MRIDGQEFNVDEIRAGLEHVRDSVHACRWLQEKDEVLAAQQLIRALLAEVKKTDSKTSTVLCP